MKVATGNYFNLYSEQDYDNYGLKVKFDIMIIFTEGFDFSEDIIDSLDLMIEGSLRGLATTNPFAKKADVKETVMMALDALNYEYERVIVDQAVTYEGLVRTGQITT